MRPTGRSGNPEPKSTVLNAGTCHQQTETFRECCVPSGALYLGSHIDAAQ